MLSWIGFSRIGPIYLEYWNIGMMDFWFFPLPHYSIIPGSRAASHPGDPSYQGFPGRTVHDFGQV
jgi:hypothetical protein